MEFVERISAFAVKYMKQEGILASLTLAQAILESGFGKSELATKANNLFGLKANSTWKGEVYRKKTREFLNNKWMEIETSFCKFSSMEECIEYRSSIFLKTPRYKPLWGIKDYKKACQIIYECGYATDPNYPQKLIGVIEKYKLYEFDKEGSIAEAKVLLNNKAIPAIIKDGRTYVQVREIAAILGLNMVYDNKNKTTKLYKEK